jgi:hypothetical protein
LSAQIKKKESSYCVVVVVVGGIWELLSEGGELQATFI